MITSMNLKVVIHAAEEGGFWAEVPALPGCVSQGETRAEVKANIREAIEGWLMAEEPRTGSCRRGHRGHRVKQVSGRDLARLVQRKGWALARIHGSHHIFIMPGRRERIVIPIHGNRPLKVGLLRSLMKIAELTETDL